MLKKIADFLDRIIIRHT